MDTPKEIEDILKLNGVYPLQATLWNKGETVYEFPFIIRLSDNNYTEHIQRHFATDPYSRAEYKHWKFDNFLDAFNKWHKLDNGIF